MNYITIPDFELMLGLQLTTNQAYAGKNWKGKATIAKYAMAAEREFSEFADEINEKWHWWAKEKRFELNKASLSPLGSSKDLISLVEGQISKLNK